MIKTLKAMKKQTHFTAPEFRIKVSEALLNRGSHSVIEIPLHSEKVPVVTFSKVKSVDPQGRDIWVDEITITLGLFKKLKPGNIVCYFDQIKSGEVLGGWDGPKLFDLGEHRFIGGVIQFC